MLTKREKALARHAITTVLEGGDVNDWTSDGIEWTYGADDWTVEKVEETTGNNDELGWEIHATQETSASVKVKPASRYEPADYENFDVTIHGIFNWFPEINAGFSGGRVEIEQEGGRYEPYD